jgi:cell division septation protein DedD
MLIARGKAGRISGQLERIPADQKRVHHPMAEADAAAAAGQDNPESAITNPPADAAAALSVTPLLEPAAPPMPAILEDAVASPPEQQGPTLAAGDSATLVEPGPDASRRRR